MKELIKQELQESAHVKNQTVVLAPQIEKATLAIIEAYKKGGKVVFFGNGGSAADAQHLAAELINKQYMDNRPPLPALAFTVDSSVLTCIGNDVSYNEVFAKQVQALVTEKDVVYAISTSGNSPNVIRGIEEAKKKGAFVIALTGATGGKMASMPNVLLNVPATKVSRIQEAHITIGHIICGLVEEQMFGKK